MLPCFYRSQEVVSAAEGEAIGGMIGAGLGVVLGTIAGIAALAALGCLGAAVFAWVCWLVVLLAVIIAVTVVAVMALVGAVMGMGLGAAGASTSSAADEIVFALESGAYVSVLGNLTTVTNLTGASGSNAIYFAGWIPDSSTDTITDETQTNNNGTTIMGQSTGTPDFCFTDPDANILSDPCSPS